MKLMIKNMISLFSRNNTDDSSPENKSDTSVIVSGYIRPDGDEAHQATMPRNLKCKQAGIIYADIADYNQLAEQGEEGAHLCLVECMRIMKAHIAANNGTVAHFAGDAILAEFNDADSALHCAINVHLAIRQRNVNSHPDQQLLLRIGISFGDVIANKDDFYGNAAYLAARLERLASSKGICVSESVIQELDDHGPLSFVAIGKQYVKNISTPVNVFWIEIDTPHYLESSLADAEKISVVA